MIPGRITSRVDQVWNAFWSGGISNPLEVIEQITCVLFIRRLDDVQTLRLNQRARTKKPGALVFPEENDPKGRPYADYRCPANARRRRLHLRAAHDRRAVHDPRCRAAGQGGRGTRWRGEPPERIHQNHDFRGRVTALDECLGGKGLSGDLFRAGADDVAWLSALRERRSEWIVLTKDMEIRKRRSRSRRGSG